MEAPRGVIVEPDPVQPAPALQVLPELMIRHLHEVLVPPLAQGVSLPGEVKGLFEILSITCQVEQADQLRQTYRYPGPPDGGIAGTGLFRRHGIGLPAVVLSETP